VEEHLLPPRLGDALQLGACRQLASELWRDRRQGVGEWTPCDMNTVAKFLPARKLGMSKRIQTVPSRALAVLKALTVRTPVHPVEMPWGLV
jgi:hypothetical protein